MKNLLLTVLIISGLPLQALAGDDIGNFLALQSAANTIAASNAGGGCLFLHKPKLPKIKYLSNGNIIVGGKEYTPVKDATNK